MNPYRNDETALAAANESLRRERERLRRLVRAGGRRSRERRWTVRWSDLREGIAHVGVIALFIGMPIGVFLFCAFAISRWASAEIAMTLVGGGSVAGGFGYLSVVVARRVFSSRES